MRASLTEQPRSLADRLRQLAARDPGEALRLRNSAALLDDAVNRFTAKPRTINVQTFLARWARARQLLADVEGAP